MSLWTLSNISCCRPISRRLGEWRKTFAWLCLEYISCLQWIQASYCIIVCIVPICVKHKSVESWDQPKCNEAVGTNTHTHTPTSTQQYIHIHTYWHTNTHIHTRRHIYMYVYHTRAFTTRTRTHTHQHTHTHTHQTHIPFCWYLQLTVFVRRCMCCQACDLCDRN